jgi:hypothetical protein
MSTNILTLRDRTFDIALARVSLEDGTWGIEIETEPAEFDGEEWAPYLYHQGLKLPAMTAAQLAGTTVTWSRHSDPGYVHPEIGVMYVFGHHPVRDCTISFGAVREGRIQLSWVGTCDILWSDEYSKNVPFSCTCLADVTT